jgi:hypothetical protein
MNDDRKAAILINDLDTIAHLIEDLPAAPDYTHALQRVQEAKAAIQQGRSKRHIDDMSKRRLEASL